MYKNSFYFTSWAKLVISGLFKFLPVWWVWDAISLWFNFVFPWLLTILNISLCLLAICASCSENLLTHVIYLFFSSGLFIFFLLRAYLFLIKRTLLLILKMNPLSFIRNTNVCPNLQLFFYSVDLLTVEYIYLFLTDLCFEGFIYEILLFILESSCLLL